MEERKNHIDENVIKRLSRIEGQIRGIKEMGASGASCTDILTQLSAVQSALRRVSKIIITDHLEHCIVDGIKDGETERAVREMEKLLEQYSKMK